MSDRSIQLAGLLIACVVLSACKHVNKSGSTEGAKPALSIIPSVAPSASASTALPNTVKQTCLLLAESRIKYILKTGQCRGKAALLRIQKEVAYYRNTRHCEIVSLRDEAALRKVCIPYYENEANKSCGELEKGRSKNTLPDECVDQLLYRLDSVQELKKRYADMKGLHVEMKGHLSNSTYYDCSFGDRVSLRSFELSDADHNAVGLLQVYCPRGRPGCDFMFERLSSGGSESVLATVAYPTTRNTCKETQAWLLGVRFDVNPVLKISTVDIKK